MTVTFGSWPSGVGTTPKPDATNVMPTKRMARSPAMTINVRPALRDSGGWKAGTPVAMASVPVSATAPEAKARTTRSTSARPSSWSAPDSRAGGGRLSPSTSMR